MASGARPERVYHQDYIARIRFHNTLPPPPNPPKLLDIPGTGLAGGQYTSAAFASRLAREQPLNIEADAELGMPIDLVGLPGVFDGDEQAIMAQDPPPPVHPHDRALLKPLSALGAPNSMNSSVSFLRRTEYISSTQGAQRFESSTSKDLLKFSNKRRRVPNVGRDDPINIIRNLVKGFDTAYPRDAYTGPDSQTDIRGADVTDVDRKAWKNPKHPSKPNVTLLDSYPLLPDLEALPTTGDFQITKFSTNPVATAESYDERLDVAILRPTYADTDKFEERVAAYKLDPTLPKPLPEWDLDLFLTESEHTVRGIKRKFDPSDPDNEDDALYDRETESGKAFMYQRIREYETYQQAGDPDDAYGDTVALALHEPDLVGSAVDGARKRLRKGAYYYPVKQRTNLRPKRKTGAVASGARAEHVDLLYITVREPDNDEMANRTAQQAKLDSSVEAPRPADADAEAEA
ncbi:hypothetical protein MBLNU459_g3286t1 [Dothideomycetes sp. NU459]